MKILVTGFAGFIGFHLTKKLIETGHIEWGIDNFNDYYEISLKYDWINQLGISASALIDGQLIQSDKFPALQCLRADISEINQIKFLFDNAQPDIVCHLAAQAGVRYSLENPRVYADTNLMGFFNVLDAAGESGIKHFIYANSSSVYGLNEKFPLEESDSVDHRVSLYAATKRSNEFMVHAYSHLYNIPTTGLRSFTE